MLWTTARRGRRPLSSCTKRRREPAIAADRSGAADHEDLKPADQSTDRLFKEHLTDVCVCLSVSKVSERNIVRRSAREIALMEKDIHELGHTVKGLNVLIVSLLIGFEAFRTLGKISMARSKNEGSKSPSS